LATISLWGGNKLACGAGSQKCETENYAECRNNPRPGSDLIHRQLHSVHREPGIGRILAGCRQCRR